MKKLLSLFFSILAFSAFAASDTDILNVRWFGAVGDGNVNDRSAIQSAIDAASSRGGGTVFIPSMTYNITSGTNGLTLRSNVKLFGPGSIIKYASTPSSSYAGLTADLITNCVVEGIRFVGDFNAPVIAGYGHGIRIQGCTDVVIRDCVFTNWWMDGITIGIYPAATYSARVLLDHVICDGNGRNGASASGVDGLTVVNSYFQNTRATNSPYIGFDIEPNSGTHCRNVTFSGCTFYGNAGNGLYLQKGLGTDSSHISVIDCFAQGNTLTGIGLAGAIDVFLAGNHALTNGLHGISANLVQGLIIQGNMAQGNTQKGIFSSGIQGNVVITGNQSQNNGDTGIDINSTANNIGEAITLANNNSISNLVGFDIRGVRILMGQNRSEFNLNEGLNGSSLFNSLISGNAFVQNGMAANNTYANMSIGTSSRVKVTGNLIRKSARWEYGTATAGTTNSITLASSAYPLSDYYTGMTITNISGTGAGNTATITAYNGGTKVATVASWNVGTPDATTIYEIYSAIKSKWGIVISAATGATNSVELNDLTASGQTASIVDGGGNEIATGDLASYVTGQVTNSINTFGNGGSATNMNLITPTITSGIVTNGTIGTPSVKGTWNANGTLTFSAGNIVLANTGALQIKAADGTIRTSVDRDAGNNVHINSYDSGDIFIRDAAAGKGIKVQNTTGNLSADANLTVAGTTALGGGTAFSSLLTATANLDFPSILAATNADLTITVSGAAANDGVILGLPASHSNSLHAEALVTSANTVTIREHNVGSIAVDQASLTYRVSIIHY